MEAGGYPRGAKCITCRDNEEAYREHIIRCAISRLELPRALSANGTNPLDNIFNEDVTIKRVGG